MLVRHRAPMADIVRAKQRAGVTVNDVCLAAVSGALRELALLRRERPHPLKAMVPVSVRADDQRQDLGNRISFAFIELPVEVRSRAGRLERVHEATAAFKTSGRPAGTGAVLGALGLLPDPLKNQAARTGFQPARLQPHGVEHSRARGSRSTCWAPSSARPIPSSRSPSSTRSSIGMFSYRDSMFFGLYADPEALPEVDELPRSCTPRSLALAGPRKRRSRRATPRAAHRRGPELDVLRRARRGNGRPGRIAVRLAVARQHGLRIEALDAAERLERLLVRDVQR